MGAGVVGSLGKLSQIAAHVPLDAPILRDVDVLIVGAGPTGNAAAAAARSEGASVLVTETRTPGTNPGDWGTRERVFMVPNGTGAEFAELGASALTHVGSPTSKIRVSSLGLFEQASQRTAADRGAEYMFGRRIVGMERREGGGQRLLLESGEQIHARTVLDTSGGRSGIADHVGIGLGPENRGAGLRFIGSYEPSEHAAGPAHHLSRPLAHGLSLAPDDRLHLSAFHLPGQSTQVDFVAVSDAAGAYANLDQLHETLAREAGVRTAMRGHAYLLPSQFRIAAGGHANDVAIAGNSLHQLPPQLALGVTFGVKEGTKLGAAAARTAHGEAPALAEEATRMHSLETTRAFELIRNVDAWRDMPADEWAALKTDAVAAAQARAAALKRQ